MKKVYAAIWMTGVLLIAHLGLQAQGSLGLYTTSVSNSTPAMNEEISLFTKLINTSTTDTFTGLIDFSLANENGIITDVTVFGKPAVSGNILTLAPLQEMNLLFTVTPKPAYFVPGPDIIIVWPIASAPIVDSAKAAIDILQATDIADMDQPLIKMFVNKNILYLQNLSVENTLKQVQIFSITGTQVINHVASNTYEAIDLGTLPSGMYIAEAVYTNNRRYAIKFIR